MEKKNSVSGQQSFDFAELKPTIGRGSNADLKDVCYDNVIRFVDGKTRTARAEAIRRVKSNGIFKTSK